MECHRQIRMEMELATAEDTYPDLASYTDLFDLTDYFRPSYDSTETPLSHSLLPASVRTELSLLAPIVVIDDALQSLVHSWNFHLQLKPEQPLIRMGLSTAEVPYKDAIQKSSLFGNDRINRIRWGSNSWILSSSCCWRLSI